MKNEDYKLIGIRGAGGCTNQQMEYSHEWLRGADIRRGRRDRPWGIFGFKRRPMKRRAVGYADRVTAGPFTRHTRFVDPSEVDVVTMTRRPEGPQDRTRGGRMVYQVLLRTAYTDSSGMPRVGGSIPHIAKEIDFAKSPRQDHQRFLLVDHTGPLQYYGPPGKFQIVRSDLWLDLCVGTLPRSSQPLVIYRIDRQLEDDKAVELPRQNGLVGHGDVLAVFEKRVRIGQARFDRGQAVINRIGGPVMCARRIEQPALTDNPLFTMLNSMNRRLNDMTLLPPDERPPVIPISQWAPRIMVALPEELAQRLTSVPGYYPTPYLKDQARGAIGPEGDYRILVGHSGRLGPIEVSQRQGHMKRLQIGDHVQLIPASAILLDEIDEGHQVQAGQPIADVCRRMHFSNWQEVEDFLDVDAAGNPVEFGNANWWFLPDFLQRQMIRPGECGWTGPGTLLDLRFIPASILQQPSWRWVFDFEPCMPHFVESEGFIICPPFYHPDWTSMSLSANGMLYTFESRADLQQTGTALTTNTAGRRRRGRSHRRATAPFAVSLTMVQ